MIIFGSVKQTGFTFKSRHVRDKVVKLWKNEKLPLWKISDLTGGFTTRCIGYCCKGE